MSNSRNTKAVWRRSLIAITAVGMMSAGLTTVNLAYEANTSKADAHTGDLPVTAECNKTTGEYDFTAKLVLSNTSGKTGTSKWRIGTSSFQGTPTSDAGMDRGPITSVGDTTVTLVGTELQDVKFSLPGTTTGYGPWFYAFTKWSGASKGSDGQLKQKLNGDCKPTTTPNPPKQGIDCTYIYRDFGRALKNGDHINVTIERQNGSQYQVNVYVDQNIAGGYNTLGFRYSDGTTRPLTEEEVKKGRIWLDLSAKVSDTYYKVQFVQINESENWPKLECGTPKPDKPEPVVEPLKDDRKSCDTGVETRTGSKTTDWVFDEKTWTWVKGTPVTTWNNWTFVRDLTAAEKKELGCVMPPPAVLHPKATVRAYCVTPNWGEGVARLINKQSTQSVRYHIVRSGKDRFVTVGAHKTRRVELGHLRVGSMVKVKVGKKVLTQAKVSNGCGTPPPPHTGMRTAAP